MKSLLVLASLFLTCSSFAKDAPILAGEWEVTTKLDSKMLEDAMKDLPPEAQAIMKESGFGNEEMKNQDCVTADDLKNGFMPQEEGCTTKEISKSKNKLVYEMDCKDPVSKSRIEFTFAADKKSYTNLIRSEVTENGKTSKMEVHQKGRWLKASCES